MLTLCELAALLTATSCGFAGNYDGTRYRCGEGDVCPDGFACVEGYCHSDTPARDGSPLDGRGDPDRLDAGLRADAAAPDDGATPDGAGPIAGCGLLSLLQDDFADGVAGAQWAPWSDSGASVDESGGVLAVHFSAGNDGIAAGYRSSSLYDLRGGALEATVLQVGGRYTAIKVGSYDGGHAQLLVDVGTATIAAETYGVPGAGRHAASDYDPIQHRHWRIREDAGTLYWETSPDRVSWNELWSEPLPFAGEDVYGAVWAHQELPGSASVAIFDDVNGSADAALRFCATSSFADGFEGPPLEPAWTSWRDNASCDIEEVAGSLAFSFDGIAEVACGAESAHLFDLRGSDLVIDAGGVGGVAGFVTYARLYRDDGYTDYLQFKRDAGTLGFHQEASGSSAGSASIGYDDGDHRYWRFSASGGTVTLSTSPDGNEWTTQLDTASGFDLGALRLMLAAYHNDVAPPISSRFAGVNAPQ